MLNDIQKSILQTVSDMVSIPDGAVNIRLDGQKEFRQNSEHGLQDAFLDVVQHVPFTSSRLQPATVWDSRRG